LSLRIDGWRRLAAASFTVTYLLIALGGIVRITGSGMGCGDHWPMCNGRWFPPLDPPTLIEWGHRLVAALVSVLVLSLAVWAFLRRASVGWRRRWRAAAAATGLLAIQVLLGAVTVWLELPPTSVIVHLGTAMVLLAVLLLATLGAWDGDPSPRPSDGPFRVAGSVVGLSAVVVLLGALVANLDAAPACLGFPLCNGELIPGGNWRVHLHWTHRLSAYLLVVAAIGLPFVSPRATRRTAWLAAALTGGQVVVAAVMILTILPPVWRALHVALGAAVFATFVAHAYVASRPASDRLE